MSNILSDLTVWSKYSRYLPSQKRRETWDEIIDRNVKMHLKKYKMLKDEINQVYDTYVRPMKVLPSMRSLQFAGKPIELMPSRIYNCAYVPIDNYEVFGEIMHLLLGGSGVGYSVRKQHVYQLPKIHRPTRGRRFLIGDSICGWADAVSVLMKSYLLGKSYPRFDFSDIRPKGAPLKTAGGIAPGPEPLKDCLHNMQKILDRKSNGERLEPIDVHDIVCYIASAVLSGGIRRSSCIALFDPDDYDMLICKYNSWWETNAQRAMANNSVVVNRNEIKRDEFNEIWNRIRLSGSGEPGIFWTNDTEGNWGTNPCQPAFATVLTHDGIKLIEDIEEGSVIWTEEGWSNVISKTSSGRQHVYEYITPYGTFIGTRDHKIISRGHKVEVQKAVNIDPLPGPSMTKLSSVLQDTLHFNNREHAESLQLVFSSIGILSRIAPEGDGYSLFIPDSKPEENRICEQKYVGVHEVFNISVDNKKHTYWTGGLNVSNCGEVGLRSVSNSGETGGQFCNLVTIAASDITSQEELNNRAAAAAFIATLQAGYTDFHYIREGWKTITDEDALIGVSMTGVASSKVLSLNLSEAAQHVLKENERVSQIIDINPAARATCNKPDGTTSCVIGCSSGIHAWYAPFYIRRVRLNKSEPAYAYLIKVVPELIEDDILKPMTQAVLSIPQRAPAGAIFRDEDPIDFLERCKKFNLEWVRAGHREGINSHSVSATVYVPNDRWDDIGNWMWKNREYYNGIAVLPYSEHTYQQAPFEECSESTYRRMLKKVSHIRIEDISEVCDNTNRKETHACSAGGCELKKL